MGEILKQPSTTTTQVYMSSTMMQLRKVLEDDDSLLFERLCIQSQIFDQDENLMLLYVAAICMNNERAFDQILARTNNFNIKPDWNLLFCQTQIFAKIQQFPVQTTERAQLDIIVLKTTLERDMVFMTELVLDRAICTPGLIQALLSEN